MKLKGFLLGAAVAASLTAFWPAAGGAATFRGVVVAQQHGSLLVAMPGGLVRAVTGHATVGSRIVATTRGVSVVGRATTAVVHGIVVRRIGTTLILSSNRHLLAVHHARVLASTATTSVPAPGAVVSTTVGIANGELNEVDEDELGEVNANSIQVQAVVAAVGTGTIALTVQGQLLVVPLPAGLTFPASIVGQTVAISLSLAGGQDEQGDDDSGGSGHDGGGDHGGDGGGDG